MKRYLVFSGAAYYPVGGWNDFNSSHNTAAEAKDELLKIARKNRIDWWQIVDSHTGEMIEEGGE